MGKIRRLSSDLANQIAAGEVVERPASIVKELIENSIDAGATRIRVEVDRGGVERISILDDGEGMIADDARLALERHATSKITSLDDLSRIVTFGFRGEALPSIASVSKLSLTTRAAGHNEGVELVLEGGGEPRVSPVGCATGTTVCVRDLFFNVPARRKFLKSQATESAHVGEAVLLAALGRHDVAFTLVRDGKVVHEYLRAPSRADRAARAIDERLEACAGEHTGVRIEAHLSPPERARSGAVALYMFVNGRPVRDRLLARAVAQAYGSVLEGGRYPVGVVYVEVPPDVVDVNVHPQKAEVRFTDAKTVYTAVTRVLNSALGKAFAIPAAPLFRPWQRAPEPMPQANGDRPSGDAWSFSPAARRGDLASDGASSAMSSPTETDPWNLAPLASPISYVTRAAEPVLPLSEPTPPPSASPEARTLFEAPGFYSRLVFLAQLRKMFLLCEGEDALYIIDQHAAAERVTFARLRAGYASRAIAMQALLIPEVLSLAPSEVAIAEEHAAEALSVGVELRAIGTNAVSVHAVPAILARSHPDRIARDLLAEFGRLAKRPFGDAADRVLATMACHGSVRAGDRVSREDGAALLQSLDNVDFAGHCPHGRPIVTRTTFEELERRVGRP